MPTAWMSYAYTTVGLTVYGDIRIIYKRVLLFGLYVCVTLDSIFTALRNHRSVPQQTS